MQGFSPPYAISNVFKKGLAPLLIKLKRLEIVHEIAESQRFDPNP
jgi:hypothetical protein